MARQLGTAALGLASETGVPPIGGVDASVLQFPAFSAGEALRIAPQTGSSEPIQTWALGLDVYIPQPSGTFASLLQTGDGDGDLFLRDNGDGTAGIGIGGVYSGSIAFDAWTRIVVTVTQDGANTILSTYVDGAPVGTQDLGATTRWSIDPATGLKLFNDNDGETAAGAVSSVFFTTEVPSPTEIAGILATVPTPNAGGFFPAQPSPTAVEINFTNDDVTPRYGTGDVFLDGFGFRSPAVINDSAIALASQFAIAGPGGADIPVLDYAAYTPDEGILVELPASAGDLSSYTAVWDIRFDQIPGFQSLLQTDVGQSGDGELFIRGDGGIGINGDYDGTVLAETWHRIAITVEDQGDGTALLSKYLDGAFLDSQTVSADRFTLSGADGFLLLADENRETSEGYLAHFALSETVLDAAAIAALGGADGAGPSAGAPALTNQIGFDNYQPTVDAGFQSVAVIDVAGAAPIQDNINDLLITEGGAPTEIDLAAAFGPGATNFVVTAADGSIVDAQITGSTLTLAGLDLGHSDITVTAEGPTGAALAENFRAIVAGENAYVFAVMPDTQDYTSNPGIAETFANMTDWLVRQKDSLAIQHMIHVGDIVQFGSTSQWQIAEDALERLDGELSYTLAVGNHDQQRPGFSSAFSFETDIDTYFTPEQVGATAAQGGGLYDGFDVGADTFNNGNTYADSIRNHYTTLTTPDGTDWLILNLEFGMPDDVLRWASEVVEAHLDHRVIVNTHSWNGGDGRITPTTQPLNTDNGGWGYDIRDNPRNVNDGEDAWREFASKYPNIAFTFNGHNFMGGAETVVSYGAGGNPVHQIFVNYQNGAWSGVEGVGTNGGNGALRLVVIDPDNDRITTHTKLVELDSFYEAFPDHQEVFEGVDLGTPEQIAIAKAGETQIVTGDGIAATVTLDPSGTLGDTTGAVFEWFTADGEKLSQKDDDGAASATDDVDDDDDDDDEDDRDEDGAGSAQSDAAADSPALSVELKTGTHRLTLKVTDKDGNVSTDEKVVIVEAPDALLTETFDDGDLAGWSAPAPDLSDIVQLGTDIGFALPAIDQGSQQIALNLTFDSHWRPFDAQTGTVSVRFDGGAPTDILRYDSTTTDDTAQRNETLSIDFLAPASASEIEVFWRYDDADNDWYWAIDNVTLSAPDVSGGTVLLAETFDGLAGTLQPAVDETIDPSTLGWTHDGPTGWSRTVDPASPAGTTEWRGWSFTTPEFWTAADQQARGEFTKGTGVIAVADGDEWDDFNGGAGGNTDSLDTTLGTPALSLLGVGGGQTAGAAADIVRIDPLTGDEGLLVTPSATGQITDYTLIFDILASPTTATFTSLFQTDVTNSGDGEIYLRNDGTTASIGISGDYDGALAYGDWGRIALVFETDGTGQQTLSKYLDGVFLDSQVVDADVSDGSRWTIDADQGFLLFSEASGFTSEIFANAVHWTPEALDGGAIAALGGVDVDGPVDAPANPDAVQFNFDNALDSVDYGTAGLAPVSLADAGATSYLVKGSIFGNPDGLGEAALYQQSNGADEILVWTGAGSESWTNYVFDMVVEPADNDTIGAVFYYQDADTHYRLTLNQQADERILTRVENGGETVLASETGAYRHFAPQDLRIAVLNGEITITLDDEMLFGGPVTDADPLAGGTIGVLSQFMDRVAFDNISVNPIALAARALTAEPAGRWAADLDGDGTATVTLTAAASLSAAGVATYEWLVDDEVVATGETAALDLDPGETTVTLRITDANDAQSQDRITVTVADHRAILVADDFADGDAAGWTIVDEGTIDGPSDWQVVDGALVQATNIRSDQQGTGSAAYAEGGDGPYILRDGTYALWGDPAALAWTDYAIEATITPNDDDGIGLLFRYTDADNYYKLEADAETGLVMLTRHLDGRESILARGYMEYTPGEAQHWRIEVQDGVIAPYIDGKQVFGTEIEDRNLPAGTIGLYGWGSEGLTFDDVVVTDLGFVPPPPPDLEVLLIDADTNSVIATLDPDGTEILASQFVGKDVTIAAFVPDDSPFAGAVESMRLDLNDGDRTRVESIEPYSLYSDLFRFGREIYWGREGILEAENTISFDLYSGNFARGTLIDTVTRSFTVVDDVQPTAEDLQIFLVDSRSDAVIAELTDGAEIDRDLIARKKLSIAAVVEEDSFLFDITDSMRLTLNDRFSKVENIEPYSLFGDFSYYGEENYFGRRNILEDGENTIEFEIFTDNWLRGDDLGTVSLTFNVVDSLV